MQPGGTQAHEGDCFVPCNDGAIWLSIVTFRGSVRRPPGYHSDGQRCEIVAIKIGS
ncbi:MAG: hypothetical protein JWQ09_5203 [Segetibacter sp.]|nr:hypothetical protein [Segetibacter sp.]